MLKHCILIGLILIFYKSQSQSQKQSEWNRNMKILEETVPMFDIKVYNSTNPDVAERIKNYTIEKNFLVVSVWERSTGTSKKSTFNLKCLNGVELDCSSYCSLMLSFKETDAENRIMLKISNCELSERTVDQPKKCLRTTWNTNEVFVKKAKQIFHEILILNIRDECTKKLN